MVPVPEASTAIRASTIWPTYSGRFDDVIRSVLTNWDGVMGVMLPTLREERRQTYSPVLPVSPTTGRVLQVLDPGVNLFYFLFDLVAFDARRFKLRVDLCFSLIQLLDLVLVGFWIALLLDRMVIFVPHFFQLALDEFDLLVQLLKADRRVYFLLFEGG